MPIRGLGMAEVWANNFPLAHLCNYTLASFTAGGTHVPADGDYVTLSNGADWRAVMLPDNQGSLIGRVKGAPNLIDLTVNVEWLDVIGFAKLPIANLANVTLGLAILKNGDTTVSGDFDALAGTGNFIVVEKSAATGAGFVMVAIVAK